MHIIYYGFGSVILFIEITNSGMAFNHACRLHLSLICCPIYLNYPSDTV